MKAFENWLYFSGEVIHGFGRGSKQLGIPTANYPNETVNKLPVELSTGVYCGFAQIENGPIYSMVMSIGFNPYFKNSTKSMETHIIHHFENDFYGQNLKVLITHFLRDERNYSSLDDLREDIQLDIKHAIDLNSKIPFDSISAQFSSR